MRCGKGLVWLGLGGFIVVSFGGCVSLDDHRRLQASNRNLGAQKAALETELLDCRGETDAYRVRFDSMERELGAKNELLANLRSENELLNQMRADALSELEGLDGKLPNITIQGPRLPAPLDSKLKQFADANPSAVEYDALRGTVRWTSDLLFALGSDVVRESSMEPLRQFTDILNSDAASRFEVLVVGHTDNRPIRRTQTRAKHPTNWHLSAHRAISVSDVLQKYAYSPSKIGVMGFGEFRPVAENSSEAGSSKNRRVEIYLVPRGSIVQASIASPASSRDSGVGG